MPMFRRRRVPASFSLFSLFSNFFQHPNPFAGGKAPGEMQYQFQPDTLRKQQMSAYDQAMQAGIQHGLHATSGSYGLPPQHYLQFPPYQGPPPLVQPQPIVHHAPVAYQQAAEPQTDKDMSPYVPSSAVFLAHSPKPYQCESRTR